MNNSVLIRCLASLFIVTILFTACSKDYSVETGASLAATGSLQDANGVCMTDSTVGTFYDGVIPNGSLTGTNDTAYVLVKVNVTTVGSFNITSTTENGVYFSDSGYFTSTGIDTIRLMPVGTPIMPISSVYSISFDSSTCNFTVVAKDSTGTGLGGNTGTGGSGGTGGGGTGGGGSLSAGQWQFTAPSGTLTGTATGIFASVSGSNTLAIEGTTTSGDTVLSILLSLPSATIPSSGTIKTGGSTLFGVQSFSAPSTDIFEADATVPEQITFTITSYNAATMELIGTFTGTAKGPSGSSVNITKGAFDVIVTQ